MSEEVLVGLGGVPVRVPTVTGEGRALSYGNSAIVVYTEVPEAGQIFGVNIWSTGISGILYLYDDISITNSFSYEGGRLFELVNINSYFTQFIVNSKFLPTHGTYMESSGYYLDLDKSRVPFNSIPFVISQTKDGTTISESKFSNYRISIFADSFVDDGNSVLCNGMRYCLSQKMHIYTCGTHIFMCSNKDSVDTAISDGRLVGSLDHGFEYVGHYYVASEAFNVKVPLKRYSSVEFYLASPKLPIYVKRGDGIELQFNLKFGSDRVEENVPFTYENSEPDAYGITNWTIDGNTLTFTNECWYAISWIRFHPVDYPELEYELEVHITDPVPAPNTPGPYLPEGGGISGGGNGSASSNTVTGTFDAQPGPSIVEKLPNGSSGADIASSGMYTKYLCNNALLNLLAEFFWEDNAGIQILKAVLGNPIDSIISLTAYPFALDTLVPKTQTTIYFGQYDSHFSAFSLTKSSFQIDWGTVTIPFFWGSFLDYSPYTKIQLYLPWGVGFVSIDPNEVVPWSSKNSYNKADFVNGTIRVVTNIELDKGACVHNIIGNNGRIIGSFGGVVGKQVPVTGSDNSARILAMISAAVSSSAAIGTSAGGTLAAGKNLAYGKGMSMAERAEGREIIGNYKSYVGNTVQSMSNALSSPPSYPRAGTFSDATNTLGYQYPYLIISRPSQSVPQQYGRFMGYPSNIFHAHLGEVRGYTEVSSIHLENINATANELDELESILKGGVLL